MMYIKRFIKTIPILFIFILFINISFHACANESEPEIAPFAFRITLPVQYEIWYSYKLGTEYRNYVYRDFTYVNGYKVAKRTYEKLHLTTLEYEFYWC